MNQLRDKVSKVGDHSQGRPEGSLFNSYNTKVLGRPILLSQDRSTLSLIHTLYCWVLSKEVSSTIFKVFSMMWPGIEPRSPGPLANTLPTRLMSWFEIKTVKPYSFLLLISVSLHTPKTSDIHFCIHHSTIKQLSDLCLYYLLVLFYVHSFNSK